MNSPSFIGVDVAQRTLDIADSEQGEVQRIGNTDAAINRWLKDVPQDSRIGVESTGCLHQRLVRAALAAGHTVYVLNARDLSHYASSLGRRAKTDRLDAQLIVRYLNHEHSELHPYRLPTALQAQLDELISRRHQVVRAHASLRQSFASWSSQPPAAKQALQALQSLIQIIDKSMQRLIAQDASLAHAAEHLRTIVGFGPLLSASMAHALTRHPFRNADAFIAYIGYDPRVRDSGQWRGRRFLSKRGSAELRRQLFAAAMSACKTQLWRPLYLRYRTRGLSSTAALVVLARKLARIAFSLIKNDVDFQPDRVQTACARP
jgi:transposase